MRAAVCCVGRSALGVVLTNIRFDCRGRRAVLGSRIRELDRQILAPLVASAIAAPAAPRGYARRCIRGHATVAARLGGRGDSTEPLVHGVVVEARECSLSPCVKAAPCRLARGLVGVRGAVGAALCRLHPNQGALIVCCCPRYIDFCLLDAESDVCLECAACARQHEDSALPQLRYTSCARHRCVRACACVCSCACACVSLGNRNRQELAGTEGRQHALAVKNHTSSLIHVDRRLSHLLCRLPYGGRCFGGEQRTQRKG